MAESFNVVCELSSSLPDLNNILRRFAFHFIPGMTFIGYSRRMQHVSVGHRRFGSLGLKEYAFAHLGY